MSIEANGNTGYKMTVTLNGHSTKHSGFPMESTGQGWTGVSQQTVKLLTSDS
jgi:hypothetical protein